MQLVSKTVVVTRPLAQAQKLCEKLEREQARVIHFPTINITASQWNEVLKSTFQKLDDYDLIIFISANAVRYAMSIAQQWKISFQDKQIATIGPATTLALENYGYQVQLTPSSQFTSEVLLEHPKLQNMHAQRVLIIRGHGGREHLREILESRGAQVDYAEVYQRQYPEYRNPIDLSLLPETDSAVLLTSAESVQNLWSLCTPVEQRWLTNVTPIAGNSRIGDAISELGFAKNLIIAENPSDQAMLKSLFSWVQT